MEDIDRQYSTIVSINKFNEICVESFGFNETNQPVNSIFCNISSLEVYRGREQAIEISHQGFFINDSGSIEVRVSSSHIHACIVTKSNTCLFFFRSKKIN